MFRRSGLDAPTRRPSALRACGGAAPKSLAPLVQGADPAVRSGSCGEGNGDGPLDRVLDEFCVGSSSEPSRSRSSRRDSLSDSRRFWGQKSSVTLRDLRGSVVKKGPRNSQRAIGMGPRLVRKRVSHHGSLLGRRAAPLERGQSGDRDGDGNGNGGRPLVCVLGAFCERSSLAAVEIKELTQRFSLRFPLILGPKILRDPP